MRTLGRSLIFGALLISAPASWALNASDLLGTWVVESVSPQGMIAQTVKFTKDGTGISGTWRYWPQWEKYKITIIDVRLNQDQLSFRQKWKPCDPGSDGANLCRKGFLWKGRFDHRSHFTMIWYGEDGVFGNTGVPVRTRLFRRASLEDLARIKDQEPKNLITKKLPLPEVQDLPPNGLALTPPMGWNSWNPFKETVTDKDVREIADALVSSGLRDAGYTYVNIDDGWQGRRDANGVLHPNSKFPDMKALADYIHSKGLKFGIYTVAGPVSCTDYVGSYGYVERDAKTFAGWGADYVKYDWCSAPYNFQTEGRAVYQQMGQALRATGRPIVYSLCGPPPPSWGRKAGGNLWRTGGDSIEGGRWASVSKRFEGDGNPSDAGPGGWNDPDIMLIGLGGLTQDETQTHMTLWSILAAPLLLGDDVRHMTAEVKQVLMNKEVIAIDQDTLGKQGRRVLKNGNIEVWTKPLVDGSTAIAIFNRGRTGATAKFTWSALGLSGPLQVRDLWKHLDKGTRAVGYVTPVPAHGSTLLRVRDPKAGRIT